LKRSILFTETEGISIKDRKDFYCSGLHFYFWGVRIIEIGGKNSVIVEERNKHLTTLFGGIREAEGALEGFRFSC